MKKRISLAIVLGVTLPLLLLLTFATTPFASSSLQLGKLQDKPSWAGGPGGPNGGDDDGDTAITCVLNIEIDYLEGHAPTLEVLDYIVSYYNAKGISITFHTDDQITYLESYSNGISDDEFATIEDTYNDNDNGYYDNWKWVLFGTSVEDDPTTDEDESAIVMGYCWVVIKGKDVVAGNYIFIADETADNWATTPELVIGAEAAVLMHEMGHSIGIGKIARIAGGIYEVYDPDPDSVMSYLTEANAGLYREWYYSDDYWATRNMKYYAEEIVA